MDCNKCYIGETGRLLNIRINEHIKYKPNSNGSTINNHANTFNHRIDFENIKILKNEINPSKRKLFEAYYIQKNKTFEGNQCSSELELFN